MNEKFTQFHIPLLRALLLLFFPVGIGGLQQQLWKNHWQMGQVYPCCRMRCCCTTTSPDKVLIILYHAKKILHHTHVTSVFSDWPTTRSNDSLRRTTHLVDFQGGAKITPPKLRRTTLSQWSTSGSIYCPATTRKGLQRWTWYVRKSIWHSLRQHC